MTSWVAALASGAAVVMTLGAAAPLSGRPAVTPAAVTKYPGQLYGVAAISASDAWAVGSGTLTLHWSGSSWARVPVPHPGTLANVLNGVSAVSASDVWAVGAWADTRTAKTLIVHWDGTRWTKVPSPSFGAGSDYGSVLTGVSATSASDVWAVGYYSKHNPSATFQSLILHWNGSNWARVPSPEPASNFLDSVTSVSATDAWAVGESSDTTTGITGLMLHWDGTSWTRMAVPSPGSSASLNSVSADSPDHAWAVGTYAGFTKTWALQWNGTAWTQAPSPSPGPQGNTLMGVTSADPGDAWAVGTESQGKTITTLALQWNGTAWTQVPTPPNPGNGNRSRISAVSTDSPTDAWAVGFYDTPSSRTLILHWNGTAWIRS